MADQKNYFQKRTKDRGPRSNNRIYSPEVQVISSDGENLGVLNTTQAISMAKNEGLDLIEISPNENHWSVKLWTWENINMMLKKKPIKQKKKQKKNRLKRENLDL